MVADNLATLDGAVDDGALPIALPRFVRNPKPAFFAYAQSLVHGVREFRRETTSRRRHARCFSLKRKRP
jgi:hypothetical protein